MEKKGKNRNGIKTQAKKKQKNTDVYNYDF